MGRSWTKTCRVYHRRTVIALHCITSHRITHSLVNQPEPYRDVVKSKLECKPHTRIVVNPLPFPLKLHHGDIKPRLPSNVSSHPRRPGRPRQSPRRSSPRVRRAVDLAARSIGAISPPRTLSGCGIVPGGGTISLAVEPTTLEDVPDSLPDLPLEHAHIPPPNVDPGQDLAEPRFSLDQPVLGLFDRDVRFDQILHHPHHCPRRVARRYQGRE